MIILRFLQCYISSLLLSFILIISASCSSTYGPSGAPFESKETYRIVKGMSEKEVLDIMGSAPYERLVLDGRETWVWVFANAGKTESFSVSLYKNKVEDTFNYNE